MRLFGGEQFWVKNKLKREQVKIPFQVQEELMLELRLSHTWKEPRLNISQVS